MDRLVRRLRDVVAALPDVTCVRDGGPLDRSAFARATGFVARGRGKPEVVVGGDVALELGHPATASCSTVLLTRQRERVEHGRVTLVGPDLDALATGARCPFGQVVVLGLRDEGTPDPFDLDTAQYLTNRLPGYMVRALPGRLWARVSKRRGRAAGLTLATVGQALIAAYEGDFEAVAAVEVVLVTTSADAVERLVPLAREAEILAGRHKKLVLSPDGEIECSDLNCNTCEEKPTCDGLRDIVIKRRERRRERETPTRTG